MVRLQDFHKISYTKPRFFRYTKPLEKIIGFDSEAYKDGNTFMFCTSEGDIILPNQLLSIIFTPQYSGANFVVWNIKYESGAILKLLPLRVIKKLQKLHKIRFTFRKQKYEIKYIPHKFLSIKQIKFNGKSVRFWDMSPFYGRTKLNTAAQEYLKESKDDIDPNLFTYDFVQSNFEKIARYCIQDAVLTQKLATLWIDKFQETGVDVTSLYSEASISFAYYSQSTSIVTPAEFWDTNRTLIRYAFEAYEGGKFEITARGYVPNAYEYDISSAYPYEIANLVDIRNSEISYSKTYQKDAVYGFIRVLISYNDPSIHLPCGIFRKLRIYPMGKYYLTITKQEYEYILYELPSVSLKIIDAAWIFVNRRSYPYRETTYDLYDLKTKWKKNDKLRSNNYKLVMNGFYGKMAQCLEDQSGTYKAGAGWNPIYASVITANTRIAITRMQNMLDHDCIAVHTDSVITKVPIPQHYVKPGLGNFEFVEQGEALIIACGIYEINGECAVKGFINKKKKDKHAIRRMLEENPNKDKIQLTVLHVESWLQAMAQNHDIDSINLFSEAPKIMKLNCDTKRSWPSNVNTNTLLTSLQYSTPLNEQQNNIPNYW